MDRTADIQFLHTFRAQVDYYLGGMPVLPAQSQFVNTHALYRRHRLQDRADEVRRAIVQGRPRADKLLTECGCLNRLQETSGYPALGAVARKNHRLFDLLLDNQLDEGLKPDFFLDPIDEAIGVLAWKQQAAQSEDSHGLPQDNSSPGEPPDSVELVQFLARRFPRVAAVLGQRYNNRPAFDIRDEYDVQDLFCGMLMSIFDDVRREEPAPSHAGSSTRIDIMLANEGIMIEVKMTRGGLEQRKVKEQLMVDIPQYCRHPNCRAVVALVYDPSKRIHNPDALQNDLSDIGNGTPVHVFVIQR